MLKLTKNEQELTIQISNNILEEAAQKGVSVLNIKLDIIGNSNSSETIENDNISATEHYSSGIEALSMRF